MQIDGLTQEQKELLELIWSLESYEELLEFLDVLTPEDRRTAQTLIKLILLERIEDDLVKPLTHYPDAEMFIEYIKNKYL